MTNKLLRLFFFNPLRKLKKNGINPTLPFIIIQPGVSSLARQYSPTSFARIARRVYKEFGYQIAFNGSKDEVDLVSSIQEETKVPTSSLAGQLTLEEMAAFIDLATLLISNNTGPVHVAAAMQTPVLDLYALTNPQHTPWKVKSKVLYFQVAKNLRGSVTLDTPPLVGEPIKNFATIMQAIHNLLRKPVKKTTREIVALDSGSSLPVVRQVGNDKKA